VLGFGSRRLERKLRQHGKAAMATVMSTRRAMSGVYQNDDPFYQSPPAQATPDLWTMTVRVQPDGAPAFDAEIEAWLWKTERPWLNTVVPVLYHPNDHRKVVLDRSPEAQNAAERATFAMREQLLAEQATSPVDRLTELINLRDRGVLNAAEYEAQKRRLLGQ
jgi:Short C-terminal domain